MGTHSGAELGPGSLGLMVAVSFIRQDSYIVQVEIMWSSCVFLGCGQAQHKITLNGHYRLDSVTVGWLDEQPAGRRWSGFQLHSETIPPLLMGMIHGIGCLRILIASEAHEHVLW